MRIFLLLVYISLTTLSYAAKALFNIAPAGSSTINVLQNFNAFAYYNVTNQTKISQKITLQPQLGISNAPQAGDCTDGQLLQPNESCTMRIQIDGNAYQYSGFIGGPIICNTNSSFFCSQPEFQNQLSIKLLQTTYIVFANEGTSSTSGFLSFCDIGSYGTINTCHSYSNSLFNYPIGIAISNNGFVYTANKGSNSISICSPATQPNAMTCYNDSAGGTLSSPRTTFLYNQHLYITNYDTNSVVVCDADSQTGALSNCQSTGSGFNRPLGSIYISNDYAYIPNSGGSSSSVSICSVQANGSLSSCYTTTGGGTITASPSGIAINRKYAYIIGVWTNTVVTCSINSSGDLTNCFQNENILQTSTPSGITYIDGYLYVLAHQPNLIVKCSTDSDGKVSNCTNQLATDSSDHPSGNLSIA
jgi:Lactonase, 7-bladed beta-propeller